MPHAAYTPVVTTSDATEPVAVDKGTACVAMTVSLLSCVLTVAAIGFIVRST